MTTPPAPAMTGCVRVEFLADRSDAIPQLARWLCAAWPEATGDDTAALERRLGGWRHRRILPLGLAAVDPTAALLGFAALEHGKSPSGEPVVLLSTVFVAPWGRRQGTGKALCTTARAQAARLGHGTVHLYTANAAPFFLRLGWRFVCHALIGTHARPRAISFMQAYAAGDRGG